MTWLTAIFTYFIVWWLLLLMVLPFGVERSSDVEQGHDPGAPKDAKIKKKAIITSLLSLFVLVLIYIFEDYFLRYFHEIMTQ